MAIAYDTSSAPTAGNNVSSLTWSHTCTGSDRFLWVGVSQGISQTETVTGVTYNDVPMTSAGTLLATYMRVSAYYLAAPDEGAHDVEVTLSGAEDDLIGGAVSLTGVHQTVPIGTPVTNEGTATPATVDVSSATGEWIIDAVAVQFQGLTANQTPRWNVNGANFGSGGGQTAPGAASVTMSWALGDSTNWAILAVAVKPSSEATWEQEGFRWYLDDNVEGSATPAADQDISITAPLGSPRRLRVLVDCADADPSATQMRLEYKEDSEAAELWRPVGSPVLGAMPAYDGTGQAAAVVNANVNTTVTPAKPSTVNAGDLLILQVMHRNDDSDGVGPATITDWNAFAGNPYGGTNNSRQSLYWRIAGAGEANQTVSVTCTGGTTADLVMARIYRFTAANGFASPPIEDIEVNAGTASPMEAPSSITPTALNRRAVCFGAIATSDSTIGSMGSETAGDWIEAVTANSTTGGDGTLNVQTADASAGTAIQGGSIAFTTSTSSHWNTVGCCLVPATITAAAIVLAASDYIAASGANTTAQLTAPDGKTTDDFGGGRMQDDEVTADAVDLALDEYGEWEWCLIATATAQTNDVYQFRVTRNGTALNTYTVTPTWTIGSGVAPPVYVFPPWIKI
jgi:hypothetical protein